MIVNANSIVQHVIQIRNGIINISIGGAFLGKKVLSPNITNMIQDQPSSNVRKHPSKVVVKTGKSYSLNV